MLQCVLGGLAWVDLSGVLVSAVHVLRASMLVGCCIGAEVVYAVSVQFVCCCCGQC